MNIRKLGGPLALFLVLGCGLHSAIANDSMLIKDMESLRDSLPFKDSGRPQLTRRLADLYFQKAVEDDKNLILSGKGSADAVKSLRTKAAKLYQDSLTGENGIYPVADGELKVKIQFQLARMSRMNGNKAEALKTLKEVVGSPSAGTELKRETLLTIAEIQDEDGAWKEAMTSYQAALPLCQGPDTISYVRYRISWAFYRQGKLKEAQDEIALALWDSQGKPKEQVIADYIQFLAQTPQTDGRAELSKIEPLSVKAGMPQLVEIMGEAFFAAGNRNAGVNLFAHAKRLHPDPFLAARLTEEYYGFRRWDDLRSELQEMDRLSDKVSVLTDKKRDAVDQILRRLIVQIDGERKSNPGSYVQESCAAIDVYLKAFPNTDVVPKMRDGWLAAQTDDQAKMERLALWIAESSKKGDKPTEMRFRQDRAAIALKIKDYKIAREEALALAQLSTEESKKREWTYIAAKASQDSGNDAEALGTYVMLAKVGPGAKADKWAIQSQNLSLSILNKGKRYSELASQAATWTDNAEIKNDPALKAELTEMTQAKNEALFESAATLGETPAALATFLSFCETGFQVEKSCGNSKVLAVKLNKQDELIRSLKVLGEDDALAGELERTGRFAEAAAVKEKKLINSKDEVLWIQVALLYQIGGDQAGQARVMKNLSAVIKKAGKINPKMESVLEEGFIASGMSASEILSLPWSLSMKMRLSADLEDKGAGNESTKKLLATSTDDLGMSWAKAVVKRLDEMDAKQRSVSFYGKNSSTQFQMRMRLLGNWASESKKVLTNAQTSLRVLLLGKLALAYADFDKEILATPMPDGLNEAQKQDVASAIESLAQPMRNESAIYSKLQEEQFTLMGESAQTWRDTIAQGSDAFMTKYQSEMLHKTASTKELTKAEREVAMKGLFTNPTDKSSLERLRDDHAARGEMGPAAYFTGRLTDSEANL